MHPEQRKVGRVPLLLVPGWFQGPRRLAWLENALVDAGWDRGHLLRMKFRDRVGSNEDHAEELRDALEELRSRSGSSRVGIAAHSMGGLAVRSLLLMLRWQMYFQSKALCVKAPN